MGRTTKSKENAELAKIGEFRSIDIDSLEFNDGQLRGVDKNPRYITEEEFAGLKKSLSNSPEFLEYKPLMVYLLKSGNYIVICGNMRLRASKDLRSSGDERFAKLPCFVLNSDTPIQKVKEYAIRDNTQAGKWDWDELANGDWNVDELQEWGVDCSFLADADEQTDDVDAGEQKRDEKDYSDDIKTEFKLEVDCKDEETLQQLYEELTERGLECRILTL